jgi:hypothetical protein
MEQAKRARKAETPKQPSLRLRLRAPYLYPNRRTDNHLARGYSQRLHFESQMVCLTTKLMRANLLGMSDEQWAKIEHMIQ